jgi:hypothetical protein
MSTGNVATTGNWDSTLTSITLTCKAMLCIASHTNTGQEAKTILWLANVDDYTEQYGIQHRYTPFWGGGYSFSYRLLFPTSTAHKVALRIKTPEANTNSSGTLQGIILEP